VPSGAPFFVAVYIIKRVLWQYFNRKTVMSCGLTDSIEISEAVQKVSPPASLEDVSPSEADQASAQCYGLVYRI
jgi:hypothetical protein